MEVSFITGCSVEFPPDNKTSEEEVISPRKKTLERYKEEVEKISSRDPLHSIMENEKVLLWDMRWDCRVKHPFVLPRIIDCVDYTNMLQVR